MKLGKKKTDRVEITHYAPDVTLSAVDYLLPDPEQQLKAAEQQMSDFLQQTAPDKLCNCYFDDEADAEEAAWLANLRLQAAEHQVTNRSIAAKHQAELLRLQAEMHSSEQLLQQIDGELSRLEHLYTAVNGGVADEA